MKSASELPYFKKFSNVGVTPRSRGYGVVTAMYICRSEIPSRIYAMHQYRQESEYGSTVIIYIPAIITQVHSYYKA